MRKIDLYLVERNEWVALLPSRLYSSIAQCTRSTILDVYFFRCSDSRCCTLQSWAGLFNRKCKALGAYPSTPYCTKDPTQFSRRSFLIPCFDDPCSCDRCTLSMNCFVNIKFVMKMRLCRGFNTTAESLLQQPIITIMTMLASEKKDCALITWSLA